MSKTPCPRSDDVVAALRGPGLDESARRHLAGCSDCAAAVLAETQLNEWAHGLAASARLPSAAAVHFRARLRVRRELAERSLRPLAIWRGVATAVAAAGLVAGLTLSGSLFSGLGGNAATGADLARLLTACGLLCLVALPFLPRRRATGAG